MSISLVEPDWPAPAAVLAGTTLRTGGASQGPYASLNLGDRCGDDPRAVETNRRLFRAAVDADPLWLRQCHGTTAVKAKLGIPGVQADAAFTNERGIACVVLTADCLPILLCEETGARVASIHAGWRGLAAGIVESSLNAMGVAPGRLLAWLGPAISQPHFEVGDDVLQAFTAENPQDRRHFARNPRGRWQADLSGLASDRLIRAGVRRVFPSGLCTYADSDRFYSYRRDQVTGRMASFIALANSGS